MHGFRAAYSWSFAELFRPIDITTLRTKVGEFAANPGHNAGFGLLTEAAETGAGRLETEGAVVTQMACTNMIHGFVGVPMFSQRRNAPDVTAEIVNSFR